VVNALSHSEGHCNQIDVKVKLPFKDLVSSVAAANLPRCVADRAAMTRFFAGMSDCHTPG
jgi:hypothetical protein